jgi:CRISPR/Cas system-associated exonuclease Cas4 (RecB family)
MRQPHRESYIRASDIGTYVYCRRAWWLKRVAGFKAEDGGRLVAGEQAHALHGRRLRRSRLTKRFALFMFLLATILLALAFFLH